MTMSDPIADLLTRIRNASRASHRFVEVESSKLRLELIRVLKESGFIEGFLHKEEGPKGTIRVYLKYEANRAPVINGIKRVSTPGCRRYVGHKNIPRILGGVGTTILSTSKGLKAGKEAKEQKLGGEMLCYVW